jgi:hypothetical protein
MADFLGEMMSGPSEESPQPDLPAEQPVEQDAPQGEPEQLDPEPVTAPEPEPEALKQEERSIPLATALAWRDEAKEYRRKVEAFEAAQRQPQNPDPLDDPAGFQQHINAQLENRLWEERVSTSARYAEREFGKQDTEAAVTWATERANGDPIFMQQLRSQIEPVRWIVQQHKRDAMLSGMGDNPDDWFEQEAAKRGWQKQSAPVAAPIPVVAVAQPVAKPTAPPRSIASERAAPAPVTPEGDKEGFLAAFR